MRKKFLFIAVFLFLFIITGCTKTEYELKGPATLNMVESEIKELSLTVEPLTSFKDIVATVDNADVLKVTVTDDKVKVEALKDGIAKITLTLKDKTLEINVTVSKMQPTYTETTILNLLETGKNNDKVAITGVIYGLTANGFYIEDSATGKIFGTLKDSYELSVGDKVKLHAEYGLIEGFPRLKSAEVVEELDKVTDFGKPITEITVENIIKLDRSTKVGTYANVFNIVGTLVKSQAGFYQIMDEETNSVTIINVVDESLFEEKENKRYSVNVVLHSFNTTTNKWEVSFVGTEADIVSKPFTLDDLLESINEDLARIPKHIYGALSLEERHATLPSIVYSYSIAENNYMSIVDNQPVFNIEALKQEDAEDLVTDLIVTVSQEGSEKIINYPITIHAIKERTVTDLLVTNRPVVDFSYVLVRGLVVALTRNQGDTIRSFILQDPATKKTTAVDFFDRQPGSGGEFVLTTSEEFLNVKIGDEIRVHAQFKITQGARECIQEVVKVDIISSGNEVVHDYENAYVLNSEESYENLGLNYEQYLNTLIKVEKPYLAFSTSTAPNPTNWVRIFHNENVQQYDKETNKRYFAFLIVGQSENLKYDNWIDWFEIPFVDGPAVKTEASFYAYLLYPSKTYLQFVIPTIDQIVKDDLEEVTKVRMHLDPIMPANAKSGSVITLDDCASVIEGGVTWTVSEPLINLETGKISDVDESTNVILTATLPDGTTKLNYTLQIIPAVIETVTITDVITNNVSGDIVKVKGVVAGFHWNGSSTRTDASHGIILKDADNNNVLYVTGLHSSFGSDLANYTVGDKVLALGDEIEFFAVYEINTLEGFNGRKELKITSAAESKMKVLNSNVALTWNLEGVQVISSNKDLTALAENLEYGKIYKLSGAFGFRGSASTYGSGVNFVPGYKFTDASDYNHTVTWHTRAQRFSFKFDGNANNIGDNWWETKLNVTADNYAGTGPSGHLYEENSYIYFMVGSALPTATKNFGYIQLAILDLNWINATRIITP